MGKTAEHTEEFLAAADRAARTDFGWFNERCFKLTNGVHHDEWCALLDNRAVQVDPDDPQSPIRLLEPDEPDADNDWIFVEAPRDHAKSSIFTVARSLFEIGKNPDVQIAVASNAADTSELFVREVSTNIERNQRYKNIFGRLKPESAEKWTESEIIVHRNTTSKDATLVGVSVFGQVVAKRADIIIADDILTFENTRTQLQRDKVKEWFWNVLFPVLKPGGRLIVVGTAWNDQDFYAEILGLGEFPGNKEFKVRKRYDSVVDEERRMTLWPERWPYQALMRRKRLMGTIPFNRSYRNLVTSPESSPFEPDWLDAAVKRGRNRRLIRTLDYASWDLGKITVANGVDLAISQKQGSDYTAMGVLGMTKDGMKVPLYAVRRRMTPAQQRKLIKELSQRFPIDIITVESNAYQKALQMDMADETDLPIEAYTTGGEKFDEEIGVNSLAVEFENGKWIIPYDSGDPYTITMMDHLLNGMRNFSPDGSAHTEDLLMAFWFANVGLRRLHSVKPKGAKVRTGRARLTGRRNLGV